MEALPVRHCIRLWDRMFNNNKNELSVLMELNVQKGSPGNIFHSVLIHPKEEDKQKRGLGQWSRIQFLELCQERLHRDSDI